MCQVAHPSGCVGSLDAFAIEPDGQTAGKTAEEVRAEDIADLFAGMQGPNVRITRMRSDIAKTAMTVDFLLHASTDQSVMPNVRNLTSYTNLQCPVYNNCQADGFAATPEEAAARTAANNNNSESVACSAPAQLTKRDLGLATLIGIAGLAMMRFVRRRRSC